jgi:hypothetical protein
MVEKEIEGTVDRINPWKKGNGAFLTIAGAKLFKKGEVKCSVGDRVIASYGDDKLGEATGITDLRIVGLAQPNAKPPAPAQQVSFNETNKHIIRENVLTTSVALHRAVFEADRFGMMLIQDKNDLVRSVKDVAKELEEWVVRK